MTQSFERSLRESRVPHTMDIETIYRCSTCHMRGVSSSSILTKNGKIVDARPRVTKLPNGWAWAPQGDKVLCRACKGYR